MKLEAETQRTRDELVETGIVAELLKDNEFLAELKYAGVDGSTAARLINEIFKKSGRKSAYQKHFGDR